MPETSTNTAREPEAFCAKCKKTGVLLTPCERCDVVYCSRSCQTLDWKPHKKRCARNRGGNGPGGATTTSSARSSSSSAAPPDSTDSTATGGALEGGNPMPFTRLEKGTYPHGRPEKDTYKLLIDAYRLRLEDIAKMEGVVEPDSIYASATNDPLPGFRRFLDKASAATGRLLPPWWSTDKQRECEDLGMSSSAGGGGWTSLRKKIQKGDVTNHYGDAKFPMQLRMLAEAVYGRGIGGQSGSALKRMMAMHEAGAGPGHMSLFDVSGNM